MLSPGRRTRLGRVLLILGSLPGLACSAGEGPSEPGSGPAASDPEGLVLSPASVSLPPGGGQRFTASGPAGDGSASPIVVSWSASGGTISRDGLYTAGPEAGSFRLIAAIAGGSLADTSAIDIALPDSSALHSPLPAPPGADSSAPGSPAPGSPPPGPPAPVAELEIPVRPGESIQAAVNGHPSGTAFLLRAGRHVRQRVVPKDRSVFRCEAGAILDGQNVTDYAFMRSGSGPDDVRIVGCVIEHYAPPAQMGAILAGGHAAADGTHGWVVDSTEVRYNANLGIRLGHGMKVRGSYVHHNAVLGIGGIGDDILVENTEIAHNNEQGAGELGFEAGGTKFVLSARLVVRGNFVHHNHGPGLWTDIGNIHTLYENNRVEDNYQEGIVHEISYQATIRNNQVRRNGLGDPRGGVWLWGAGIGVHSSPDVEIYGNVVEGNRHGIVAIQQNRGSGRFGPYLVRNLSVHDNTVTMAAGESGVVQDVGDTTVFTGRNNRFTHNTYRTTGNDHPFAWMNRPRTEAEWLAYGQDATGSFSR